MSHHRNLQERKNFYQTTSADHGSENEHRNQNENGKFEHMGYMNNEQNPQIKITQQALNYAVGHHLPPIHIMCQPKLTDHNKAKELIRDLLSYIDENFRKINKNYNHPLGFEYWYIDKNGDLTCFTKQNELFIFLCIEQNYPKSINSIELQLLKPKHLPGHHSLVLKYVPNYVSIDDIKNEIGITKESIYNLEEMNGSKTDKYRHLRLEINSTTEYNELVKKGGMTIDGLIIEVKEFLSPPRILICTRCNDPGHIRKYCKFEYEACRRCGEDRNIGEHKQCKLCCQRCNQQHMATDYQCQYIIEYRRLLLQQLKQKPYLLPPNVQIFIPTEYRERNTKNNKVIVNPTTNDNMTNNQAKKKNQQETFNSNVFNWPLLPNDRSRNNLDESSIWKEIKRNQEEIEKIKEKFEHDMLHLRTKYNENLNKLKTSIQIIAAQSKYHNENIERCYSSINGFIPILSSTFEVFMKILSRDELSSINNHNNNEIQTILHQKQMNNLTENQGQLLLQAVNSISVDNE